MNRLVLIKDTKLFQGQRKLNSLNNYFEGWYFKNTFNDFGISFIPGINIENGMKLAFIQVITKNKSYYLRYDFKDFKYSNNPFYIKIGNNIFSDKEIILDIIDGEQSISIKGKIKYRNNKKIKRNIFSPNIMGPFSYLPFMECNHAIISMKNSISGNLKVNGKEIDANNGIGYIEKDWGVSFPKSYIWYQGNSFKNKNTSICFSIADIPLKIFKFKGFICVLIIDGKEYRFTTYNGAKLINLMVLEKSIIIKISKDEYILEILIDSIDENKGLELFSPVKGKMSKKINETINVNSSIRLYKNKILIAKDKSSNCGFEIVNYK